MKSIREEKLPRGLKRVFQDSQLKLTYRHHRLVGAFLLLAGLFWMCLLAPSFRFIAGGNSFGLEELVAFLPFAAAAFGFSYAGLAKLFNYTELKLDHINFQTTHKPFPWLGAVSVPTEQIGKFLVRKDLEPRDIRHNVTLRLVAELNCGKPVALLCAISDSKAASFMLKELQAHLLELQSVDRP